MQSLGAHLRDIRVARGVSLEEVSRTTRVGHEYLEALESDAFERLPAPVFTKGFIRAYCVALGEPAEEALARYRQLAEGTSASPTPAVPLPPRPAARGRGPVLVSLVLLVALGLGLFALTLGLQGRLGAPASPQRATSPASRLLTPAPALGPVATSLARTEPSRARLVARTTEPTWVRVQTDDGTVVQELLPAGATREWVSAKRFVLTIGNAGGVSLELNGQLMPPLGARGAVIQNLIIPAEAQAEAGKP